MDLGEIFKNSDLEWILSKRFDDDINDVYYFQCWALGDPHTTLATFSEKKALTLINKIKGFVAGLKKKQNDQKEVANEKIKNQSR